MANKDRVGASDPDFHAVVTEWLHEVEDIEHSDAETAHESDPERNSEDDKESELDISDSDECERVREGTEKFLWTQPL